VERLQEENKVLKVKLFLVFLFAGGEQASLGKTFPFAGGGEEGCQGKTFFVLLFAEGES
jgi:hypothetical protein